MKLSIVIPAFNEEAYLGRTLEAVENALTGDGEAEIIVVDNESTDRTAAIAAKHNARIVRESTHNIGAVRNAGGRAAMGDAIVFLDADTLVAPGIFEKICESLAAANCIGGSVAVEYEPVTNRKWVRYYLMCWQIWGRFLRMRQGALQFCRRDAFERLGGYDTTIYLGEDIEFHWRLDKLGRESGRGTDFIESPAVVSSSRRWERMGLLSVLYHTHPIKIFLTWRSRRAASPWYDNAVR